ncbi:hypothetical protein [Tardiphaga sp. 619_E2_N8_5]|uniref:hypothetical protein n=1 Tax=unclassified Tardiphaga TaxID=2631404 RepID=UPI003F238A05
MSEPLETKTTTATPAPPPTAIEIFLMKVMILTAAAVVFFYAVAYITDSFVSKRLEGLQALKGGKAFWSSVENKLYSVADAPEMPPDRKAKILESIKKISDRYRPYLEAAGVATPASR